MRHSAVIGFGGLACLALLAATATPVQADRSLAGTYDVLKGQDTERGSYRGTVVIENQAGNAVSIRGRYSGFRRGTDHRFAVTTAANGDQFSFQVVERKRRGFFTFLMELFGIRKPKDRDVTYDVSYEGGDRIGELMGTWRVGNQVRRTDVWHVDVPTIIRLEPSQLPAGRNSLEVTVIGEYLPRRPTSDSIVFLRNGRADRRINISQVRGTNDDRTELRLVIDVDKLAALGSRDFRIGENEAKEAATVTPPAPRIRLGQTVDNIRQGEDHDLFIPIEDGKLTFTAEVELRDPSGNAVTASDDGYVISAAGHYNVVPAADGELGCEYKLEAKSKTENMPWHFWYFPYVQRSNSSQNLYSEGGVYEKIDQVVGVSHEESAAEFNKSRHMDDDFELPEDDEAEKAQYVTDTTQGYAWCYQRSTDDDKSWWGHCWGAVVASSLYQQPEAATVKDTEGNDVAFSEEETEGLITSYFTDHGVYPRSFMNNCPSALPTEDLNERCDRFADDFFLGLHQGIGKEGLALACNLRAELTSEDEDKMNQVWNHVVYGYEASIREVEGANDAFQIEVDLEVEATNDVFPSGANRRGRFESYVLRFRASPEGGIKRDDMSVQNWVSAKHYTPSYLWKIQRSASGVSGTKNRPLAQRVTLNKLEQLFGYKPIGQR